MSKEMDGIKTNEILQEYIIYYYIIFYIFLKEQPMFTFTQSKETVICRQSILFVISSW